MSISRGRRDRQKLNYNLFTILAGFICLLLCLGEMLGGFPVGCQCRRRRFDPWGEKILWRRAGQPTPVFLLGESHAQRNLAGYSPWGQKS